MESFRKEIGDINENQTKLLELKNSITKIKAWGMGSKVEWKGLNNTTKSVNWKLEQRKQSHLNNRGKNRK